LKPSVQGDESGIRQFEASRLFALPDHLDPPPPLVLDEVGQADRRQFLRPKRTVKRQVQDRRVAFAFGGLPVDRLPQCFDFVSGQASTDGLPVPLLSLDVRSKSHPLGGLGPDRMVPIRDCQEGPHRRDVL